MAKKEMISTVIAIIDALSSDRYMTVNEISQKTGCSATTVKHWLEIIMNIQASPKITKEKSKTTELYRKMVSMEVNQNE